MSVAVRIDGQRTDLPPRTGFTELAS